MYWLRQPPYLRWIAAALVLLIGIFLDTRPADLVPYPFAADLVATGQPIDDYELRDVPAGVLPEWSTAVAGFAVAEIAAGSPIVPNLATSVQIPIDWWAVSIPLAQRVAPGTPIRIALEDDVVEGLVVGEIVDSGFELVGPVAFPSEQAARVAAAAGNSALVVMIGAERRIPGSAG